MDIRIYDRSIDPGIHYLYLVGSPNHRIDRSDEPVTEDLRSPNHDMAESLIRMQKLKRQETQPWY